jgi:hypothetical protein
LFSCATDDHSCKVDISECHSVNLIRLTVDNCVSIRFYHVYTEKLHSKSACLAQQQKASLVITSVV